MINEVPAATPVTIPVVASIVALAGILLVHVPPDTVLPKAVVAPTQTVLVPEMDDGAVCMVIAVAVLLVRLPLVLHVPAPDQVITQ